MAISNAANGRPQRKQLSDQLDRFDALLDGLSEGLNESIADAVRDGTRLALKDALVEIMTDPMLRAKLQQATAPPPRPVPTNGFWAQLKKRLAGFGRNLKIAATAAGSTATQAASHAAATIRNPSRFVELLGGLKSLLHVGLGAGVAVAAVSFFAPHAISATLSGISGAIAAMALRGALWTRRAMGTIPLT